MNRKTIEQIIVVAGTIIGLSIGPAAQANPPPQTVTNLTVISVSDVDYGGEVIQFVVSQPVVTGCTSADFYSMRDTNIIKGGLAVGMTALITSRSIDLYVTGACDTSGRPLVGSITLH